MPPLSKAPIGTSETSGDGRLRRAGAPFLHSFLKPNGALFVCLGKVAVRLRAIFAVLKFQGLSRAAVLCAFLVRYKRVSVYEAGIQKYRERTPGSRRR